MLKFTSTDKAPAAIGPYSQAVAANGFLFALHLLDGRTNQKIPSNEKIYPAATE